MFKPEEAKALLNTVSNGEEFKVVAKEILGQATTAESQETVKEMLIRKRDQILESDPVFRAEFEARSSFAKSQLEQMKPYRERVARASSIVKEEVARAKVERQKPRDEELEKWVDKFLVHGRTRAEAEKQEEEELACPICDPMGDKGSNRGNTLNGVPFCFQCKHKLVPVSELGDYNRSYRRKHLKELKKNGKRRKS